jgi:hypothetical protein
VTPNDLDEAVYRRPFTWSRENGFAAPPVAARETPRDRDQAVALSMAAVGAARMVTTWRLEKRWLASLQRAGHPHPYRGLAWRTGLLNAAGSLPAQLLEVRRVTQTR